MKKLALAVAAPALAALTLMTACGPSSGNAAPLTPKASAEASIAVGEAQGCMQQGSFLSHDGRTKIKLCVENLVPKANRPNAAFCAGEAVLKSHSHAARENALANCLTKYGAVATPRPSAS